MAKKSNGILGKWVGQTPVGLCSIEVISKSKMLINGQPVTYSIRSGSMHIVDKGTVLDLDFVQEGEEFTLIYPNGYCATFQKMEERLSSNEKRSSGQRRKRGTNTSPAQLYGRYLSYSNASNYAVSNSGATRIDFDGRGSFQISTEIHIASMPMSDYSSSPNFSAYGSNFANPTKGVYEIVGDAIQLSYSDGTTLVAAVNRREINGTISEFLVNGKQFFKE